MSQVNVTRLHEDNADSLALSWLGGRSDRAVLRDIRSAGAHVGHLNLTHPNGVQVVGAYEAPLLDAGAQREDLEERLFAAKPAAIIVADGLQPGAGMLARADSTGTPLFSTPQSAERVVEKLSRYLTKLLAERTERHGVFMDVLGLGVLITGDSGVGKSELGLELISRGHGLVADDVVEISRIAPNTLEGRCPPMLKDFLEVRGLGLLNIRTIFGETAVRPKMKLKLIAHLEKPSSSRSEIVERLPLSELSEDIIGVTVRKVLIPVAAGRNLAVLLEAAVRAYILRLRGIDSNAEFIERQRRAISEAAPEDGQT